LIKGSVKQAKKNQTLIVRRKAIKIVGDTSRVITRPHIPGGRDCISRVIGRIMDLPVETSEALLTKTLKDFSGRHEDIHRNFDWNFNRVKKRENNL
jgi:hypothetical protein